MEDDIACRVGMYDLFFDVIEHYDPYSADAYTVTREMWDSIQEKALSKGGELKLAIDELTPWVNDNFIEYDVFTIIAI